MQVLMDPAFRKAAEEGDVVWLNMLVAANPDMVHSVTPDERNTALHIAASNGHVRFIHRVLRYMNNDAKLIVTENSDGDTPLHLAMRAGHLEVVEHLIRYATRARKIEKNLKESLTVRNKKGNTLLHEAASNGHVRFIQHVLWDMNIDVGLIVSANSDGDTPLHLAVRTGHLEVVEHLTRYAAQASDVQNFEKLLTVRNKKRNTLLHEAASNGHVWCVHHVLLYMNIDVGLIVTVNSDGDTPLHLAVSAGHLQVVEHLMQYATWARNIQENLKEPLLVQNKKGNTLLHEAIIHGMYRVAVKLLLGAKEVALAAGTIEAIIREQASKLIAEEQPIIRKQLKEAKVTYAGGTPRANIGKHVEDANKVVRMNDALLILRNADGHTPWNLAVKADNFEMIEMLIKCDLLKGERTRAKIRRARMDPALTEAAGKGDELGLKKLLADSLKMVYSVTPKEENTALHIAASNGHHRFVQHVLRYMKTDGDTPLLTQNSDGDTPLHLAVRAGHLEVVAQLIRDMAPPREIDIITPGFSAKKQKAAPAAKAVPPPKEDGKKAKKQSPIKKKAETSSSSEEESLESEEEEPPIKQKMKRTTLLRVHEGHRVAAKLLDGDNKVTHAGGTPRATIGKHVEDANKEPLIMQNKEGNTPLHEAVIHGMYHVAVKLLEQGATKEVALAAGTLEAIILEHANELLEPSFRMKIKTPGKHLVTRAGRTEVVRRTGATEVVIHAGGTKVATRAGGTKVVTHANEAVRTNDVLLILRNADGHTPLHLAVKARSFEMIEMLIKCDQAKKGERTCKYAKGPVIMADNEGNTPLHEAVMHRMSDVALKLLEANPRCGHTLNAKMQSPLYIAARQDLVDVVKKIHDQGLTPNCVSTHGTALHQAVLDNDIRALEILLNKYVELLDLTDTSGNNAMHYAAETNNACMVSILLNKKSTLAYKQNNKLRTPVHVAAMYGSEEATQELLRQCSDVIETVDMMGRNALHIAIIKDKVNMLELLLKHELTEETVNQQDRDGNTPLHVAAKLHQEQPTSLLLQDPRVNLCMLNHDGHTAWDYQIPRERMDPALTEAACKGDVLSLIKLLADSPKMIYSVTSDEENTALHIAASNGHDWFVHHALVCMNMNVDIIVTQNSDGDTPLHLAVRGRHLEVVEQLIHYMAWAREIEANLKEPLIMQNKKGNTWLHEAVIHDRMYRVAVDLLGDAKDITCRTPEDIIKDYDKYADDVVSVNDVLLLARNGDGDTPLHLALTVGNLEFADMLINSAQVMKAELTTKHVKGPITMANRKGNTPLHEAVLRRMSDIALKLLEANPTCAHTLNARMQSPLYIAASYGLTHVVKKIADQALSVDTEVPVVIIPTHGTALHQCVLGDNIWALEMLLNKYVQLLDLTDSSGDNVLHYAARTNNARMVSILLNEKSTLAYEQNNEQRTPLHVAAMYGSMEAGKEILKQFPDVIETVDSMGRNAIHIATINGKVNMLKLLLKYVLPEEIVNRQDKDGNTPLHVAVKFMQIQPATLLLNDPRVNPCLVNRDGHTAFGLSGRTEMDILEMSTDEKDLWKELKRHESKRCKQQKVTTQVRQRWQRGSYVELSERRYTIVATLMAMATFAVTLTMPGRYSRQSGTAIVGHHLAFKIFVVCNTLSMCGSTVLVLCFIWRWRDPMKVKLIMLIWAFRLIVLCGLAMIISMLTAVHLTIAPESQWVAYVAVAIGASTPLLVCLILRKRVLILLSTNWWVQMEDE